MLTEGATEKRRNMMKFPKVVAAVAAMEQCQWRIGDALLEEIPIGKHGNENGSWDILQECAEELEDRGYAISPKTLKDYRTIANVFPKASRDASLSWTAHRRAGSPEMLTVVQKVVGSKKLTTRAIEAAREVVQQHQAREYREEQRQAGIEPKKTPKFLPKPTIRQEHIGGLRLMSEVLRHMGRLDDARDVIENATSFVRENLTRLDKEETELFTDLAFDIAKKGHKLADAAQRLADRRKKFLSVVGE
jgi:hypothetical protein